MYAYVDETGNTGKNLFDENQPDFITAALVTRANFDAIYSSEIKKIAKKIGKETLHANEMGFSKIEEIAVPLLRLFKKSKAQFCFSRVEKKYLLATKVIDHLFDSGENSAVPWHMYNIKPLRISMVFGIAKLLDLELAELFWACLMERHEERCRERLVTFTKVLLTRVDHAPDERTRNLILNAGRWVIENPQAILIHTKTKHGLLNHTPNMVAFTNLLDEMDRISQKAKRPIKQIVHDQQDEFKNMLSEWHDLYTNASDEEIHRPGETYVLQKVPGSEFTFKSDKDSAGLQSVDIVLWLVNQVIKNKPMPPQSCRLFDEISKTSLINDFSFRGVDDAMEEQWGHVFSAEMSEEQLKAGQEMLEEFERNRQENMAAYKEDGLRPFERAIQIQKDDT